MFLASPAEIRRSISSWVTSNRSAKPNKAKHRGKYAANVVGQKFSWFSRRGHQENFCAENTLESWISGVLSNPKFAKRASQQCKRTSDSGHSWPQKRTSDSGPLW